MVVRIVIDKLILFEDLRFRSVEILSKKKNIQTFLCCFIQDGYKHGVLWILAVRHSFGRKSISELVPYVPLRRANTPYQLGDRAEVSL